MLRRLMTAWTVVVTAVAVVVFGVSSPVSASHFIAVEAKVDLSYENNKPYATLTLSHEWVSSGSFSVTVKTPSGTSISPPSTVILNQTGSSGKQVIKYDLSGQASAGLYRMEGSSGARVDSINVSSSASFSFQAGFWFDPAAPQSNLGSPRFTAAVITNVRGGDAFSQNLGAESPDGNTLSYSFIQDTTATVDKNGAPVQVSALGSAGSSAVNWTGTYNGDLASMSNGVLSIPAAVSQAFATSSGRRMAVKIKVEERDANNVLRGFVTRDIGFIFKTSSNVAPIIDGVTAGQTVSLLPGGTQTLNLYASDTAGQLITLSANNLPSWATLSAASGTNPVSRTLTFSPPANASSSSRTVEITARDNDGFPLTSSVSFVVEVVVAPSASPGNSSATVTWSAPQVDAPQQITNYSLRYSSDAGQSWTIVTRNPASTSTTEVVPNLVNGQSHIFQFSTFVDGVQGSWSASSPAIVPGLPYATTNPTIAGTVSIGQQVSATDPNSNWTNPAGDVMTPSYQWKSNGNDIPGAINPTFTITAAQVNTNLSVVAKRTNGVGTGTATSSSVSVPNALLTGLAVSVGSLSPAFASDVLSYTVQLPADTASVSVTPTFGSGTATVNGTARASGASQTITTPLGLTTIQVAVTNGGTATYSVTFNRVLPAPDISYPTSSVILAVDTAMGILTPTNSGGASSNWTVSPQLPAGLSIAQATGVISGTPTSSSTATSYTVTATNATDSDTFVISLSVLAAPSVSYPTSLITVQEGVAVTPVVPTSSGGAVNTWSINPAIGNGLLFDVSTGVISGTPTAAAAGVQYTITANNISGTSQVGLTIIVGLPPTISYEATNLNLWAAVTTINLVPRNTGGPVASWSVTPSLPLGLTLDSATGVLSGIARALIPSTTFTFTANGVVGDDSAALSIEVRQLPLPVELLPGDNPPATVPLGPSAPDSTAPVTTAPITSTPPSSAPPTSAPITVAPTTEPPVPVTIANGELPRVNPGRWQALQNGEEVQVVIELVDANTWQVSGDGFSMRLEVPGGAVDTQTSGVVTLFKSEEVEVVGNGYRPGSLVDIWLFSSPTFLGSVRVGADGSFEGSLPLPDSIAPGLHTLQANGISLSSELRSLNLGVRVETGGLPGPRLPITGDDPTDFVVIAWWVLVAGVFAAQVRRIRRHVD